MLQYLILLLAIPLGLFLKKQTAYEKEIYSRPQYFPSILIALIIGIIYFSIQGNETITLTLGFIFITILVWWKS